VRYFITLKIKSKPLSTPQLCWRIGVHADVDHLHVFWSCPKILPFWNMFLMEIQKIWNTN